MITPLKIGSSYVNPLYKEFLIDGSADVANLPTSIRTNEDDEVCSPGSIAYTNDLKSVYMMGNDNVWRLVSG